MVKKIFIINGNNLVDFLERQIPTWGKDQDGFPMLCLISTHIIVNTINIFAEGCACILFSEVSQAPRRLLSMKINVCFITNKICSRKKCNLILYSMQRTRHKYWNEMYRKKRLIKGKVDKEQIALIYNGFIKSSKKSSLPEKQTS